MAVLSDILSCGFCVHPEFMVRRSGTLHQLNFPSSVAVFEQPGEGIVLFDTGYTNHFIHATRHFPERFYRLVTPVTIDATKTARAQLESRGIRAKDVRRIILSHFHGDHIAGLKDFPQAKIISLYDGYKHITSLSRLKGVSQGLLVDLLPEDIAHRGQWVEPSQLVRPQSSDALLGSVVELFGPVLDVFQDGSLFLVPLPGHSPGHCGLLYSGPPKVFLIADAVWKLDNLKQEGGVPVLTQKLMRFGDDYQKTIERISTLTHRLNIVPCHCDQSIASVQEILSLHGQETES